MDRTHPQDPEPPTSEHMRRLWGNAKRLASFAMRELHINNEETVEFPFVDPDTADCFTVFSRRYIRGIDTSRIDTTTSPDIPLKIISVPRFAFDSSVDIVAFVYDKTGQRTFSWKGKKGSVSFEEFHDGVEMPLQFPADTDFVEFVQADLSAPERFVNFHEDLEAGQFDADVIERLNLVELVIQDLHDAHVYNRPFQL